jgi:hypothetical protein
VHPATLNCSTVQHVQSAQTCSQRQVGGTLRRLSKLLMHQQLVGSRIRTDICRELSCAASNVH